MEEIQRPGDSLFLNERLSDIVVNVCHEGRSWRFPAHGVILRNGSTLLNDLDPESKVVIIYDITPDTMLLILRFLYKGTVPPLNIQQCFLLLKSAERFEIAELAGLCQNRLLSNVSLRNICQVMEWSWSNALNSLARIFEDIIKQYAQVIFPSQHVLHISPITMQRLLAAEDLNVVDESVVFKGLWRWAKHQCCSDGKELNDKDIADSLGQMLSLVRFQNMKDKSVVPPLILERIDRSPCSKESAVVRPRQRFRQPQDLLERCLGVVTQGSRSWEGVRPSVSSKELCVLLSFDCDVYLTAIQADVVEQNPQGNVLYITVTRQDTGAEIQRQQVNWADVYDRKTAEGEESWLLCDTRLPTPVLLSAGILYSIHLITMGSPGEAFPWQSITQRNIRVDEWGLHVTLHSTLLIAVRKLYVICLEPQWY